MFVYRFLLVLQFSIAAVVFVVLFFYTAPYGRYSKKNVISLPPKTGWFIMELPAFATILTIFILGKGYTNPVFIAFIIIWEIHYFQRVFVYPAIMNPNSAGVPVYIVLNAMLFNLMNGYINGYGLFIRKESLYNYGPALIITILCGITGYLINLQSDSILRKIKAKNPGQYSIPQKGLHRLISSPNYFGELLEWGGWAVLTWSLPGLAFFLFTFANLAPRAWKHRKWYRDTFGSDYPENRKAIIPFIF